MSRLLLALALATFGCARPVSVPLPREARVALPAVLPAGIWAFEGEDGACIDCPTARAVVLLERGPVDVLARVAPQALAPGYPFVVEGARVGDAAEFVLVGAMLASEADAQDWIAARGELGAIVATIVPGELERLVVRVVEDTDAYGRDDVGHADGGTGSVPRCTVAAGHAEVVRATDLVVVPDGGSFVPVRCADGSTAFVAASATDLRRTTWEHPSGGRVELQESSRVCGSITYEERVLGPDGALVSARSLETERCFGQPAALDAWSICPGGDLEACVARAVELRATDPEHARRLAAYACRQGLALGCVESVRAMEAVGASAEARLGEASLRCGGDPDVCAELDRLYATIDPAAVEGDPGSLAYEGCARGHDAWCAALERSEVCDPGGCG